MTTGQAIRTKAATTKARFKHLASATDTAHGMDDVYPGAGDAARGEHGGGVGPPAGLARLAGWLSAVVAPRPIARRRPSAVLHSDPWEEFRRELDRSRRYERQFVLVRVPGSRGPRNGAARPPAHAPEERLQAVAELLRSVDRAWLDEGDVYILLPECSRAMGEAFVSRLERLVPWLVAEVDVRIAAFPGDGMTSGALLAVLHGLSIPGMPADACVEGPARRVVTDVVGEQPGS
jgi:hypothetical protein